MVENDDYGPSFDADYDVVYHNPKCFLLLFWSYRSSVS
jgi:hypothetical protein